MTNVIFNNLNPIKMTNLDDLLFDVEKVEVAEKAVSAQKFKILGYLDGKNEEPTILNNCSNIFNLFDNKRVFPVIEQILDNANCTYKKAYKMNEESTSFSAVYIIEKVDGIDVSIDLGNGDKIYVRIMADNSYNGEQQAFLAIGLFRLVCSNGLMVPYEGSEEKNFVIKGKHTDKLNHSFDTLITKLHSFLGMSETIKRRLNVLTDKMVPNYADRVEEVINATKLKPSKAQIEAINETIAKEANLLYGGKVNEWLIYNGINAYIFKGLDAKGNKSKALPSVKRKADKKVMDYLLDN